MVIKKVYYLMTVKEIFLSESDTPLAGKVKTNPNKGPGSNPTGSASKTMVFSLLSSISCTHL
jgi:hypothetical protein